MRAFVLCVSALFLASSIQAAPVAQGNNDYGQAGGVDTDYYQGQAGGDYYYNDGTDNAEVKENEANTGNDNVVQDKENGQGTEVAADRAPQATESAIALSDYQANEEDEISFKTNDIISKIDKVSDEWWLGEINGQYGYFPSHLVQTQSS